MIKLNNVQWKNKFTRCYKWKIGLLRW
jgi:hypothetical protein